jgi:CRISPR-associated protein Csd1
VTILQSLARRYDRQAQAGKAPVRGFAPAQISFTIVLSRDGAYVRTDDERTGEGKKRRPCIVPAPAAPKRTLSIASGVFWDKTSYVLGATAVDVNASAAKQAKDAERLVKEQAAFRARHENLLAGVDDAGCSALLTFLRAWMPDRYGDLDCATEMLDQNVAFRLEGEHGFFHDRPAACAALSAEAAGQDAGAEAMCLVTGKRAPIARLHPSIKGVPGAQSSGAALVSFNLEAFTSYGHSQGDNAPVSEDAAFAYATALNGLLTPRGVNARGRPRYPNRVMLGETTVPFWAEYEDAERLMRRMVGDDDDAEETPGDALPVDDGTETAKLGDVMRRLKDGIPLTEASAGTDLNPATRVYVLGLSPNAARLSVRFWVEQTLGDFTAHFQAHWSDLMLEPRPRFWPPPLWALLLELAPQRKSENIRFRRKFPEWLSQAARGRLLTPPANRIAPRGTMSLSSAFDLYESCA